MPGPMPQRSVVPDLSAELALVEVADVVVHVLRRDVERDLGQKEVRADARRRADPTLALDVGHELARERARVGAVERKVGRRVDEALVDGVHVDVLSANSPQVDAVDLR